MDVYEDTIVRLASLSRVVLVVDVKSTRSFVRFALTDFDFYIQSRRRSFGSGGTDRWTTSDQGDVVDDLTTAVRAAVRRAHGVIDGGFDFELFGVERDAQATDRVVYVFYVKVSGENHRKVWSALTLSTRFDDERPETECVYDVLGVEPSLVRFA